MLKTVIKASENFCIHQLRLPYEVKSYEADSSIAQKRTLIAYIDIDTHDNKKYRVYLACEHSFVQKISKLFLEEDESDEETLMDMLLETVNLIVGSAKVIAEEEDENAYTINTPHFATIDLFEFAYDEAKTIKVENSEMTIAIKELDV